MSTFIEYLIEGQDSEEVEKKSSLNLQSLKLKVFPKIQAIVDTMENTVPNQVELEFLDLMQMIKQIIITQESNDIDMINKDIKTALNIVYSQSNVSHLLDSIKSEIIDKLGDFEDLSEFINIHDLTLDAEDEFGNIMYRIYSKDLKSSDDLDQSDLNSIKIWINKIKRSGNSFNSQIRNRLFLKNKLFDKLKLDKGVEEIEG
jgi:hypothetical protein